jgi:hypothetical protein
MRWLLIASLSMACNRADEPPRAPPAPAPAPAPASSVAAPAPDAAPPIAKPVEPVAEPSPIQRVPAREATKNLDAMLDEIDKAWRKNKTDILKPVARPGFRVSDDNGLAVIIPDVELPIDDVHRHLVKRAKNVKNSGMKMYTDGSLVAVDPAGQKVSNEPRIVPLNDTLIVFLTPSRDAKHVARIDVAMP